MRSIKNIAFLLTGVVLFLLACNKVDDLPYYDDAQAPTLTASVATIAPAATDSNNVALRLSWTDPRHSTDSANVKYTIQLDSAGKNFATARSFVVMGNQLSREFIAKELNTVLLSYNYAFNQPVDMEVRVISSYANNNEPKVSNTVKLRMTPYKVPPKVALPASGKLFLVGSATQGGWANPVPTPSQEFARLDETTFAGVFQLNGGSEYLVLPVNGDWTNKYSVSGNTTPGLNQGGNFGFNFNDNFPGPTTAGWYKIVLDFQQGKFTVTPYGQALPTDLYIVGNATAGGWNNPVPVPSQRFTRINSSVWQLTLPLIGGGEYLLLPVNGDWNAKYGAMGGNGSNNPTADEFKAGGGNLIAPAASGTYKLTYNFAAPTTTAGAAGRFTVTP
jgi:starch-binding outer membrane protein SusE/F